MYLDDALRLAILKGYEYCVYSKYSHSEKVKYTTSILILLKMIKKEAAFKNLNHDRWRFAESTGRIFTSNHEINGTTRVYSNISIDLYKKDSFSIDNAVFDHRRRKMGYLNLLLKKRIVKVKLKREKEKELKEKNV